MFQFTRALEKIRDLKKRIRVVQGGTSASKTFSILAYLSVYLMTEKKDCSIVSETIPHLRRGAMKDWLKIMESVNQFYPNQFNKSTMKYQFDNGSTLEFFSVDVESKLRGARRDILFCNEANALSYETYLQLATRTNDFIILDFNPTAEFWAHTELKDDPDTDWIVLTYKDSLNVDKKSEGFGKYLAPAAAIKEIKKAKAKADQGNEFFKNWYQVYGLGEVGKLSGAVFQNWIEGEFKEVSKSVFGQDYGMNDPTTLVQTSIDKKRKIIYAKECFYKSNLVTSEIAKLNKRFAGDNLIIGDSAEKRLILELSKTSNIKSSIKGQGSVNFGISMMQDYQIIVDPESKNLISELKKYVWLEKKSQTPIDAFCHCIDAMRYAIGFQLSNPYQGEYHIL